MVCLPITRIKEKKEHIISMTQNIFFKFYFEKLYNSSLMWEGTA